MRELLFGPVEELLGVVFYALLAGALTVVGSLAEIAASQDLSAGQTTLAAWEAGVGLLLLYAGYAVAVQFVLPNLRSTDVAA